MENQQSEALRLADIVERLNVGVHSQAIVEEYSTAARELRRLHARNQELESRRSADTAGALFDFAGYLTSLPAKAAFPVGSHHSAEPMVEALKAWAKTRALSLESADVVGWDEGKKTAPPVVVWEVNFTEREEFEAWWMLSPKTSNKRPARLPDGQYANSLADHAWNGWQGRAAATIDLTEGMLEKVAAPVVLPEPSAWMLGYQTMGGDVGWKLSFSQSGAGICQRLKGEEYEKRLYTEQQVRDLLAEVACTKSQTTAQEPFGYFKAEPFGWRDCAETDEGAIALYEAPQPQADGRDAQRYRWLIDYFISDRVDLDDAIVAAKTSEDIAKIIDAAIAASKEKAK